MDGVLAVERGPRTPEADGRAGGVLGFGELYEVHFAFVWRNVRRLGVDESAADDAVQDVFLVVHRRLSEFEGRSSFKTWLFGILVRVARDHRRARQRNDARLRATAKAPPESVDTPADSLAKREAATVLEGLLAEVGSDKREVFILVELEQMSVADAAVALELNPNTAHSRLRAARQEFEEAVKRFRAKERR